MAELRLESLRKSFRWRGRAVDAVAGLTLSAGHGELLAVVGPSGCGKTTMLRLVAGLARPEAGRVVIDGIDVTGVAPRDRDVAMVFQSYALYPHKSVAANLAFGLKMRGVGRAEARDRVERTAALLGIGHLLDRRPAALSGGEQQRVALGRAMARQPRLFLFDEPLANLDAQLRQRMRAEIKDLQRRLGTTTVYVTHDQEEAMTLGDRVAVMHRGRVRQCDSPMAIYCRPGDAFVAGFLGSPAMNLVTGRLANAGASTRFVAGDLTVPVPAAGGSLANGDVVLGVRPEHIALAEDGGESTGAGVIKGRVRLVEPLGSSTLVHVETGGEHRLVARISGDEVPSAGSPVAVAIRPEHLHLFAADGEGERLN